ncbi:hypothetical protein C2S51_021548 [Perilla frutescens var. frutescens]|nr:hypothetical protein C2S51_021548 [Perilla frutescens var. frutescens]
MKLISNKKARLVSFEKREKGLKKAAHELSTLCGVDIGMIIYNAESNETVVWPERPGPVARMIELHESSFDQERRCKTYGVSDYFKEHRERVEKEIKKMREKIVKGDCEGLSHDHLRELGGFLNARIGAVRERISLMKAGSGVLMDPSVQESRVFAPGIRQEQQPWTCFDGQDNMGSRNMCSESKIWRNSLMQESTFSIYNDLAYLVEGSRNPYLETNSFLMNQAVQGTATLMPDIIQQQQHAYIQDQNENMMMMNGYDASCNLGISNFDGSEDNYAYFLSDNCFLDCGMQTEVMDNAVMNEVEEQIFMSYVMLNEETVQQNWQEHYYR